MPRFFFDVDTGPNSHSDDTGIEMEADKVSEEAGRFLRDLAKDEWRIDGDQRIRVSVRDAQGHSIYESQLTLENKQKRVGRGGGTEKVCPRFSPGRVGTNAMKDNIDVGYGDSRAARDGISYDEGRASARLGFSFAANPFRKEIEPIRHRSWTEGHESYKSNCPPDRA